LYTNTHSEPDYTHYDYEESNFTKEVKEICLDNSGIIQVSAKMTFPHNSEKWGFEETAGILASIPCYHGFTIDKLPENMGYNGFNTHVLAVMRIAARKDDSGKLKACAVIGCRACGDTVFSVTIDELKENFEVTTSNEPDFYYLLNELEYMQIWIDRNMEG
jgi:hypothetical protein